VAQELSISQYFYGFHFLTMTFEPVTLMMSLVSCLMVIGATTVGTGGDWSPQLLGWGDQQCIGPPNFLAVVFKKQEISQQVSSECRI